ncbi:MAG TPA: type II toxin-antitoxin system mRNA interferase toxin, RelE/StbE family [Anaerolineae bacterium]|nr:type II toxin-antitoxin system mRNA interferase toxin, RelE/StbE family [Anaerolineae bacterium]
MKVEFKSSFAKDLKKVKDKDLKARVKQVIELVEKAKSLQEIQGTKKLKGGDRYYRIRIEDYRVGLTLEGDTVTFVRFLHRKDIYRYFP